ncbi:MAG TPA: AMP-binding protein [Clostridia bacterium]|nr:MAG: Long-chain-fatty-acid--CoA ligase [Firmicutes bacterium ADurb.Bin146]HOD93313.1 AMP-binding protein [Clostridia bacterium]HQM39365.1 AMP-binding protein [Clostridia bacterium]
MKYAFSTISWTSFTWKEAIAMAKDLGFSGIEVRGLENNVYAVDARPFSSQQVLKTAEQLANLHLEVSCFSTTCNLNDIANQKENIRQLKAYIDLAAKMGTSYVRLLPDDSITLNNKSSDDAVISIISEILPYAEKKHVILLLETIGIYCDTDRLRKVLEHFASDNLAALWDIHHPYRFNNESPEKTVQNLGAYIKYVHMKDSVMIDGQVEYRLMGEGDLPIKDMIGALKSINYDGYISYEWIMSWSSDLDDPGIVFPHFMNYITSKYDENRISKKLYYNKAKTGRYVWKKEELIDSTFPQVLDRMVEEFPDQYAFRYTTLDYTRTYSQFREDVDTFARSLIALGVKRGDHVAIWATNIPQWYITFWATTKIGAVLVTVNTAYKIHEAEYLFRQSDTHTIVMIEGYKDSHYAKIVKQLCPELDTSIPGKPLHIKKLPFLRNIITVDFAMEGCITWEDAIGMHKKTPIEEVYRRASTISKDDVCNMQYTSGTTGFPKGVMLTHHNIVNNGKCIGDCMDLSTADRMMIHVPMFHCFGMVLAMTASMTHGTTISPLPYFSPKPALNCINLEKITCFHGVPTMFIAMLEHEDFAKTDFSYMRTGIMAGSPCPIKVMQDVQEKMNMKEITIVYGQTEASPGCTQSTTEDSIELRVNTVGKALPGVECKIVDPETNEELPDNVDGEFVARGYNIMKGYYKMPMATAAAIDKDGWLHTGDLARRNNGYYKITGRIKDMIIRGGENIYPKEIEDFIYTHPKVKDVQVIGVPDKSYGEEIMACVILKENETMTEQELKDYVNSHMAKHKTPKYVDFVMEFPMNAAGKILKYKMREDAVVKLNLQEANKIVTA